MTATQTYRKALVCCEDFLPDFAQKLVNDGAILSELREDLIAELFVVVFEYIKDTGDFAE